MASVNIKKLKGKKHEKLEQPLADEGKDDLQVLYTATTVNVLLIRLLLQVTSLYHLTEGLRV
jgi:hypothetical protein